MIVLLHSAYPEISSRVGALKYQIDILPLLYLVELLILLHLKIQCTYERLYNATNFAILGREDCLYLARFQNVKFF